jgi:hypothetical protein
MIVGVAHQGAGNPITAVCRADVEPPDLGRASSGQRGEACAADRLTVEVSDQEDPRRPVDILQAAAFKLEHGRKVTDVSWHRPLVLSLGGCHVLEDQGDGVVAGRESVRHCRSGHVGSSWALLKLPR